MYGDLIRFTTINSVFDIALNFEGVGDSSFIRILEIILLSLLFCLFVCFVLFVFFFKPDPNLAHQMSSACAFRFLYIEHVIILREVSLVFS